MAKWNKIEPPKLDIEYSDFGRAFLEKYVQSLGIPPQVYGGSVASENFMRDPLTEKEWLAEHDVGLMVATVQESMSDRQKKHYVEACRRDWDDDLRIRQQGVVDRSPWPHDHFANFSFWVLTKHREEQHAEILRDIIGNPYRPVMLGKQPKDGVMVRNLKGQTTIMSQKDRDTLISQSREFNKTYGKMIDVESTAGYEVEFIDPSVLTWENGTIPRMARKIAGVCSYCEGRAKGSDWSCINCEGTGYISEPELRDLPELADALEYAGVTNKQVLAHLRGKDQCPECVRPAEAVNHVTGHMFVGWGHGWQPCYECEGSADKAISHVKGCWALELFLANCISLMGERA